MSDHKIEYQLKEAVSRDVPEDWEKLWEKPVEKASGDEWYLEGTESPGQVFAAKRYMKLAAAACVVICFVTLYMQRIHVASRVYIDGRQSIVLEMNRRGQVVHARATDQKEQENLDQMDLETKTQDEVMKSILDSMQKTGSIKEERPVILLSVEGKDEEYLCEYLSDVASSHMDETVGGGLVCDQVVEKSEEVKNLEKKYRISRGKATLIQKLAADDPDGDIEKWVLLPIDELVEKTREEGVELKDYLDCKENPMKDERDAKDSDKEEEEGEDKRKEDRPEEGSRGGNQYSAPGDHSYMEEVEPEKKDNYLEWEERYHSKEDPESEESSKEEGNYGSEGKTESQTEKKDPEKELPEKGNGAGSADKKTGAGEASQPGNASGSSAEKNYESSEMN